MAVATDFKGGGGANKLTGISVVPSCDEEVQPPD